jgi:hypothetical protein
VAHVVAGNELASAGGREHDGLTAVTGPSRRPQPSGRPGQGLITVPLAVYALGSGVVTVGVSSLVARSFPQSWFLWVLVGLMIALTACAGWLADRFVR